LILANRPDADDATQAATWTAAESEMEFPKTVGPDPPRGGTLVICPLIALTQWRAEIEKFVREGGLSVVTYHGNKRADGAAELAEADVVLTTYAIIQVHCLCV
jgi:SNF2-related domain